MVDKVSTEKGSRFDIEAARPETEKPHKVVLTPAIPLDMEVRWVPQVPAHRQLAVPKPSIVKKGVHPSSLEKSIHGFSALDGRTPPPAYFVSNGGPATPRTSLPPSIPLPPLPADVPTQPPTPPTPPVHKKFSFKLKSSSPAPQMPPPLSSPARSESFSPHSPATLPVDVDASEESDPDRPSGESGKGRAGQRLPRLMTVVTTFVPNMEDELAVKIGDTVRMLEEYHDGWCLAQLLVGRVDAPQGVIPRFCLEERQGILPTGGDNYPHFKALPWR